MWAPSSVKKEPLTQPPFQFQFQESGSIGDGNINNGGLTAQFCNCDCKQETQTQTHIEVEEQGQNLDLPPSPPPLPSVFESTVPECGCDNLNPLSVPLMPESIVPPATAITTKEPQPQPQPQPPMKKLRHTPTPHQSTQMFQLLSGTNETGLTTGDAMEAPLVDADANNSDDAHSHMPPTGMAPPPPPPTMKTQATPSGCLPCVVPVSVYAGGEVLFKQVGAQYSIPARFTFPATRQTTFTDVTNKIYKDLKLSQEHFSLDIQARYNAASTGCFFFTLLAINDEIAWRLIFQMAISGMNWHIVELYVKPVPNETSQSGNHNPASSSGTSSTPQWNLPIHTTPFQTMLFNSLVQGFLPGWSRPQPVSNQTCQNYNPNPTTLPTSTSMAQQSITAHPIPSQNMPCNSASCSKPNPISSSFPGMSSSLLQNTPMHAKPSQTKPCTSPTQGSCMRPPPVPNHPNPTNLPGSSSIAKQSVPVYANPSQTMPHKSSAQGSCSGPKPTTSGFPITSSKTHQNMPTHANDSQTKHCISNMQGSSAKAPPISNHPNLTSSLDTNNVTQESMPVHVKPFETIPYRLPVHFHQNGLPFSNPYPAYKGSFSVNETFESRDHLMCAINEFHINANIEIIVKRRKMNKLVLTCKSETCEWLLVAAFTAVDSNWVIKACPHPHTCHAPTSNHSEIIE